MNHRLSSRAIVIKNHQLLLNEFDHGSYYNFPGGGLEDDETLRANVEREVLEETGYTVHSKELILVYEYNAERTGYKYGKRNAISYFFRCVIDEDVKQVERTEIDTNPDNANIKSTSYQWIDIDQLDTIRLVPDIKAVVYRVAQGYMMTEFYEEHL
jgi:8-oxo-dGTP pyrophosphatase MutT (NUDIX family)